jgi:hypothetical protein
MIVIKYEKDNSNYCLVHKTSHFVYYLLVKNNNFYYYENFNNRYCDKTLKICKKFLKTNNLNISNENYDDFILAYKCDEYVYGKNDYHLITETFGNDGCVTFCVIQDGLKIKELKGQRFSPTFIFSVILTKFNFEYGTNYHAYCDHLLNFVDYSDKNILKIKKYINLLFSKYVNYSFEDLNINFNYFWKTKDVKIATNAIFYYEKIINLNIEKIINRFNLTDKNKKFGTIYYGLCYFVYLYFKYQIKAMNIKNKKIIINSCVFNIKLMQKFFINEDNKYIFSEFNSIKTFWLMFIDKKYNHLALTVKDKYKKRMKKIFINNLNKK